MHKQKHDETGSSTVGFLFSLPLLCLMLAAIIDFGRLPLVMGDLTTEAGQLSSRFTTALEVSDVEYTESQLAEYVRTEAPSLNSMSVSVEKSWKQEESKNVPYQFYDPASKSFKQKSVTTINQPVTLTISVKGEWLTPVGKLVSGSNTFELQIVKHANVDKTISNGVW